MTNSLPDRPSDLRPDSSAGFRSHSRSDPPAGSRDDSPSERSERTAPRPSYDVAVVGAGPAGLAAAVAAARLGRSVALVDAGARPGGQYGRHGPEEAQERPAGQEARALAADHRALTADRGVTGLIRRIDVLRSDPRRGIRALLAALSAHVRAGQIDHLTRHHVWTVTRNADTGEGFTLHTSERELTARRLVLAPGAYDRQVPFPGWDLPGVYTAGAAQALWKEHRVLVGRRVVVAGTGPFLLSVATELAEAGATVQGVVEANAPSRWLRPDRLGAALRAPARLADAVGYAATLGRRRIPVSFRSAVVAAHGERSVEAVTVARLDRRGRELPGTRRRWEVDAVAVGWGFTPQLELPLALGCATALDADGSLVVTVDVRQESSVPGVFVAGEATGVGGAALAACEGTIAGHAAAGERTPPPARLLRRRAALRGFAAALHGAYPVPSGWMDRLTDDTLVCRCEEVDKRRLRAAVDLGAEDVRTAKLLSRVGMGWCQGRVCGYAAACLTAAWAGTPYDPSGLAERPIADPVSLGDLASRTS